MLNKYWMSGFSLVTSLSIKVRVLYLWITVPKDLWSSEIFHSLSAKLPNFWHWCWHYSEIDKGIWWLVWDISVSESKEEEKTWAKIHIHRPKSRCGRASGEVKLNCKHLKGARAAGEVSWFKVDGRGGKIVSLVILNILDITEDFGVQC